MTLGHIMNKHLLISPLGCSLRKWVVCKVHIFYYRSWHLILALYKYLLLRIWCKNQNLPFYCRPQVTLRAISVQMNVLELENNSHTNQNSATKFLRAVFIDLQIPLQTEFFRQCMPFLNFPILHTWHWWLCQSYWLLIPWL